jgi:hypothetical protein
MVHVCNPSYSEVEIRRVSLKISETSISTNKLGARRYVSVIPATWEVQVGGWWSKASPRQKHETLFEK